MLTQPELNKILDFIQEHNKYTDRELLSEYIRQHDKYGTFDYAVDDYGNVVGIVRWNVLEDGKVAEVLDMATRRDMRNKGIGRDFILKALIRFPKLEILRFKRGVRGDNRIREVKIDRVLQKNIL